MPRWVCQRTDRPKQLDYRARPAMRHYQWQRIRMRGLHVDEMDVHALDFRAELRQRIESRFAGAPVVLIRPVAGKFLKRRQLDALRPIADELLAGPAGSL